MRKQERELMDEEQQSNDNNPEEGEFLSDLLDTALPGEGDAPDPEANPETEEGQPAVPAEPKPDEGKPAVEVKPEPATEAAPAAPTEPKTYEYRGKQYTLEQMVELGILDDVVQTARQFPTIQTKYQSLLEEKTAAPAATPGGAPAPQGPTGDQILNAYTPVAQEMAAQGYIEPEAFEVFPKLISALMFHRDLIYEVRNTVAAMAQGEQARSAVTQKDAVLNYVGGLCDKVSGEGEHFTMLKDGEVRKGFYEYLGTLNVPIKQVGEDFVRKQWVAYNADPMLEAVRLAASGQKAADVKTRRNAKGEGGGVRPAPSKPASQSGDIEMIESFLD